MDKFGRAYRLTVQTASNNQLLESTTAQNSTQLTEQIKASEEIQIELPLTIEFDIQRNVLSSANTTNIRVYNLAETTRRRLYKDKFSYNIYQGLELKAGYGDQFPTIFKGNIQHGWSVRQGVNFISNLDCYDGGFALVNGKVSQSYPKGTPQNVILDDMIGTLPNVQKGVIGSVEGKSARGNTYVGNTGDIIDQLTNGKFFIDLERAYILGDSEAIQGSVQVITSESGLLGTPVREETLLNFDMIFEPRLLIGQAVELQSLTAKNFNGIYKVVSLHHRGTVSDAVAGTAVTSVGLWRGPEQIRVIN